ncbi:MAG: hypothetical protein JXB05_34425 [Myxococcaceae bacterium]|nr:hypothetical protein [Myxococcaceae bacterium]
MAGWRGVERSWRGLLAAVLLSAPALAQETVAEAQPLTPEAPPAPAEASVEAPEAVAGEPEEKRSVRVFGRVFARASADERDDFARALSLASARVGVSAAFEYVEAEVTADLSSKSLLKDAFVRIADGDKRLRLYAGQFKAPFLARELESSWELPLMRRGLVDDYLTETHQLGGRRLGLMGEVRLKQVWNLRFSGGLFEGSEDEQGERTSEDAAARVSVRPFKALTVGASSYLAQVLEGTRQYAVAADGVLELGGLALSAELAIGHLAVGPFTTQLGLATYTLPLSGGWALQPLAGAEALQLSGEMTGQGWAAVGGVNVLFSDSFKAQLQAERALRPGDEAPGNEYSLQLATRF